MNNTEYTSLALTAEELKDIQEFVTSNSDVINYIISNNLGDGIALREIGLTLRLDQEKLKKYINQIVNLCVAAYKSSKRAYPLNFIYYPQTRDLVNRKYNIECTDTFLCCKLNVDGASPKIDKKYDALVSVKCNEKLPYILCEDLFKDEAIDFELLIPPYCEVLNMVGGNTYVRQNSYYTYEMTIKPVSYDAILEQEEILEVEENVFVKSLNMVDLESKWLKEVISIETKENDIKSMDLNMDGAVSQKKNLREQIQKHRQALTTIRSEYLQIKENLQNYIMHIVAVAAKEIDEKYEIEKHELETFAQRQAYEEYIKEFGTTIAKLENLPRRIQDVKQSIIDLQDTLDNTFVKFSLSISIPSLDVAGIKNFVTLTINNLTKLRNKLENYRVSAEDKKEDILKSLDSIKSIQKLLDEVEEKVQNISKVQNDYKLEYMYALEKLVAEYTHTSVLDYRLNVLIEKEKKISARRISFIGKMFGKDKIKEAELEVIDLEKKVVKKESKKIVSIYRAIVEIDNLTETIDDKASSDTFVKLKKLILSSFDINLELLRFEGANSGINKSLPVVYGADNGIRGIGKHYDKLQKKKASIEAILTSQENEKTEVQPDFLNITSCAKLLALFREIYYDTMD